MSLTSSPPFRRGVLPLALLALGATACASGRRASAPGLDFDSGAIALHVVNRSSSDVVVYLADGIEPARLGRVGPLDRVSLPIPHRVVSGSGVTLLVITTDSGRAYVTDPVVPGAGGVIELMVQRLADEAEVSVLFQGALAP